MFQFALELMIICHFFLTVDIKNPICEFEDIDNEIQRYRGDLIQFVNSADFLPLKLNQLPLVWSGFHLTLEIKSTDEYLQIRARIFDIPGVPKKVKRLFEHRTKGFRSIIKFSFNYKIFFRFL